MNSSHKDKELENFTLVLLDFFCLQKTGCVVKNQFTIQSCLVGLTSLTLNHSTLLIKLTHITDRCDCFPE